MKLVHVASELFPYMKTGGLADAVGALTSSLAEHGQEVTVFLPGYRAALEHPDAAAAERRFRLKIEMGEQFLSGDVRVFSPRMNLTVYLVCRDEFFDRRNAYGNGERDYEDNADRFIFFCKAVVETLRLADLEADIVHGHDWQAALVPLLLREAERRHGVTLAMKTFLTIHNIAYHGLFPAAVFSRTNLPAELNGIEGLEYYGQVNFLKGGILFADRVTTVSPTYAREIQKPEFGCGLEGVVQSRSEDLVGLLNGIDPAVWNPGIDALIPARYSAANLAGKKVCRRALLAQAGFDPAYTGALFGVVCRMVEQKGLDFILANKEFFLTEDCRLFLLAAGDRRLEDAFGALAAAAPERFHWLKRHDEKLSHLIEAGCDFFLMPSVFEPCGLNQMYSQVYGTIPVVTRVGGLVDTVIDLDDEPDKGTGIMCPPTVAGVADGLSRALKLFTEPERYAAVQKRGMAKDFSWEKSVDAYQRLYQEELL
jgi:starch synthase